MRVVTLNLLHGRSLTDGRVDPGRLQQAVRDLAADVLGLQEVDRGQDRSHGLDLTGEVAAAMGAADWRFAPALMGTPGGSWRPATDDDEDEDEDEDEGEDASEPAYGCGLVSRYPVRSWHTIRLPAARVRSPVLLPGTRRLIWLSDEPRVAVAAVVDSPIGVLTVAATHLSFVPGWNGVQLRTVCRELARLPAPRVLLGDLNMPPPFPAWLTGWRSLAKVATYPTGDPRVQLDHVLGSGRLPAVSRVEALPLAVSDHRALSVEL